MGKFKVGDKVFMHVLPKNYVADHNYPVINSSYENVGVLIMLNNSYDEIVIRWDNSVRNSTYPANYLKVFTKVDEIKIKVSSSNIDYLYNVGDCVYLINITGVQEIASKLNPLVGTSYETFGKVIKTRKSKIYNTPNYKIVWSSGKSGWYNQDSLSQNNVINYSTYTTKNDKLGCFKHLVFLSSDNGKTIHTKDKNILFIGKQNLFTKT